ncbi:hypothetical protein POTOM_035827 [Populus tomentosa]|uniref:VOC domain-containing protein n=1 Tax=Populus tomentosa TaxID=118781 RepID=A0A8X8CEI8_POPTO|nr:hypothetical protein POTOM_035827 [Populus tomentosa]
MYSKLDLPNSAQLILQLTPIRCVVTWTALISGSVQNGYFSSALINFSKMRRENIKPNDFTFPCAFKASTALCLPFAGKQIHAIALKLGQINDKFVGCSAFDMYSKTGLKFEAQRLFDEMPPRNVAVWNAYISNAVLDGRPRKAIDKFIEFRRVGGEPDLITFCAFLNACADARCLDLGRQLHGLVIRSGFERDVSVANGIIDFYGKCKEVELAEMVFNGMGRRNSVSWCTMVAACEQNDEKEKACVVFLMGRKEGIELTDYMVSSVISAYAGISGLEFGRSVHALAVKACVEVDIFVGSALVDMYGKCGSIEDCEQVFHEMPERNLVSWNAMISGYAHQGDVDMAMTLFEEMQSEAVPNYVTLICVLSACSRGGAVKLGNEIFESMRDRYRIEPGAEHYACIVDMLGRAGMVERAYEFVQKMPIRTTISVWGALLNACRVYGKPELGKIAADNLFKLDPKDSGNHVLLSNMFAAAGRNDAVLAGRNNASPAVIVLVSLHLLSEKVETSQSSLRWDEATLVRKEMKEAGIKKGAGCSWVTAKNKVHVFQAKDASHERNSEIQAMLVKLRTEMQAAGYMPDTNYALYDLEEEEKMTEVGYHSEKIALAFGLLALPPGVPIRITKNLRICDIRRLADFYKDIFGFEEIESPKFEFKVIWLKISPDLAIHLIERSPDTKLPEGPYSASSPVLDPTHLPRGHHVCFSVSNFDSFVQSLKDKGIETFQRSVPNRPIRQVFFFDPDGNGLEVASRDE